MTYQQLDQWFPWVVFGYGVVMTFMLNSKFFLKLAEQRLPAHMHQQFTAHRTLGFVCLMVGAVWTLQHLVVVP